MGAGRCRIALIATAVLLASIRPAAFDDTRDPAAIPVLPSTIQVDTLLEPVIASMLAKSPTFVRQCRVIAGARIVVAVHIVPTPKDANTHAHATLRRYSSGLMVAVVEVPAATALPERIAHEFEHIAEFIEGIDHARLAATRPGEASQRLDGAIETVRAVTAGKTVYAEMSAAR